MNEAYCLPSEGEKMKEYIIKYNIVHTTGLQKQDRVFAQSQSQAIRNLKERHGNGPNDTSVVIVSCQLA